MTWRRAPDLAHRVNARGNISENYVVFKETHPLALKNHVRSTGRKTNTKVCMEEMMGLIECMSKYNQDKSMCSKELAQFQSCTDNSYALYQKTKGTKSKEADLGRNAKMTTNQLNAYLKKFPTSGRYKQLYMDPKYTENGGN